MIDRFTKWPEAVPLPDVTACTVAQAFYDHWITRFGCPAVIWITRFGCPAVITDQRRQFESSLFRALSQLLGIKRIRTSSYHPQANGLIEEFHRPLKAALKVYDASNRVAALPTLLMGFRSALKEDIGAAFSELVYGKTICLPGEFFNSTPMDVSPKHGIGSILAKKG
ncbi:uncharacterized protein LOC118205660 [Stegodyphus dumicola]|uniref:uncharacterized protein LOC118205660 n=1 Tax=Stegodyphus dumicola TaxID=202533 RepID=UPI0015AF2419|nr:uncharacterized protein LOC118205660 [Stegodyphus dumicola]